MARRAGLLRVLYAERSAADIDLTRRHLQQQAPHIRLEVIHSAREVFQRLPAGAPCPCDVLLLDYRLPGENALEVLKAVGERGLDLPVVLVTGQGDEEVAVQALRLGAADYLVKRPGYLHKLPATLENAHHRAQVRREQAALGEREERFRQLAENIQEVFWLTDPAKNQMLYISPGYEKIWGRTCASLYAEPRNWLEAIHPEDRQRVLQEALTRQVEGTYDEEYRIVRLDSSLRWIRDRAFPVRNAAGQVYRIAGVAEDITKHKELETQFLQAQKLEAVGQLAGGVAHDFNNLLTIISGYSELLLKHLEKDDPRTALVGEVQTAADRGAVLVRQLLAFSRRQVAQPEILDLNAVIAALEKMLRPLIREDIELRVELAPALGQVRADRGQLEQVLLNLVVNARDAMPQGGQLRIATSALDLDHGQAQQRGIGLPGPYVVLSVRDTGVGMDAATQARIFEPFFTTKEPGQGTGLGLATVYGIVRQSGGAIQVHSKPGKGTTFEIYLPRAAGGESAAASAEISPEAVRGAETLLLVEDEEGVRRLVGLLLREAGYTVLVASRGEEALQLGTQHQGPIHLVISDMVMPGMRGSELAERLQGLHPALKVLFISGYAEQIAGLQELAEPGVAFLQKPFRQEALLLKVRQVLDA
jgi:PAS domain S-box-containing protein